MIKRKVFFFFTTLLAILLIGISSCKHDDDPPIDHTAGSASFKIGTTTYSAPDPHLLAQEKDDTIKNTLTINATDGSKIIFHFLGDSTGTYSLDKDSAANFTNVAGRKYSATSGELIISSYSAAGSNSAASGSFHFKAKSYVYLQDSLEITNGIFSDAKK
jgi:hypothetical protein